MEPYEWEPSTEKIASAVHLRLQDITRMDTNTSPFLPEKSIRELRHSLKSLCINEYPDTSYTDLRRSLSSYCKFGIDHFAVTNGADEALDIISKVMLNPGDEALIPSPSYSMFRVVTEISGSKAVKIPRRRNFDLNIEAIGKKITKKTKIVFLCSPNNPTGNSISAEDLKSILDLCEDRIMVVVDEAYSEYSGRTFAGLTEKHDNLVIVRTFSKAFAMAGVRVGYIISSKETTETLNKVRPPNSLSNISLSLAKSALKDLDSMRRNVAVTANERRKFEKELEHVKGLQVFPSDANFVLIRVKDADFSVGLYKSLMKHGFVIRNFSRVPGLEGCLRITINKPRVNRRFLGLLARLGGQEF